MRTRQLGFTLIEILVFIVITSMVMSTILYAAITSLRNTPSTHNQWVAIQSAQRCMEWFLDQRRLNGYSTLTCPSTPSPSACTVPGGFALATSIACTTWNSDVNYKTITVSVTGLASVTLSSQIGDYQ